MLSLLSAVRAPAVRTMHTSAMRLAAPRPKVQTHKLKTHSAAKKRFFPIAGSGRSGAVGTKFAYAHSNKQHLNSGMSRARLSRLRGTESTSTGPIPRMLRRLLAPIV